MLRILNLLMRVDHHSERSIQVEWRKENRSGETELGVSD
jgi:hypothetical protein